MRTSQIGFLLLRSLTVTVLWLVSPLAHAGDGRVEKGDRTMEERRNAPVSKQDEGRREKVANDVFDEPKIRKIDRLPQTTQRGFENPASHFMSGIDKIRANMDGSTSRVRLGQLVVRAVEMFKRAPVDRAKAVVSKKPNFGDIGWRSLVKRRLQVRESFSWR